MSQLYKHRLFEVLIHFVSWTLLFLFPLLLSNADLTIFKHDYLHYIVLYISFLVVYYANYFVLIDKQLFRHKVWSYILANMLLLGVVCTALQCAHEAFRPTAQVALEASSGYHPPMIGKILNDLLSMFAFWGLSVLGKMVMRWRDVEKLNNDIEKKRTETELNNLKQQLSPHFIFNTLNNIYALVAYDSDKAQQAILQLSGLLRHMLYENKDRYVLVEQEMEFVCNYIELMRLRQTRSTRIDVNISTEICNNCYIAPLLFITLIGNAFKHGIDPTKESYIDVNIVAINDHTIRCRVANSCHQSVSNKNETSGIGLENLRKQLQLLYPDNHQLCFDITREQYNVELTINLHKKLF